MHVLFFQMKRAYHSTLRLGHRLLSAFGLTPARFDLLYVIMHRRWGARRSEGARRITQREIRNVLGVSAPTVSRMLDALEDLGLVRRRRCEGDRRENWVHPTARCMLLMRRAARELLENGYSELAARSIAIPERWFSNRISEAVLARFLERLRAIAVTLGDRAGLTRDMCGLYSGRRPHELDGDREFQEIPTLAPYGYLPCT
jgi:DNA-binding MarR family transcriptional regulator